ncbi:hypothetical protein [Streptomyces sp. SID13726]|uniref:hypothetical protein n=1 Tax=Streptomyces sp. SID13726 TaxID=2706058 RepID=UPI0013BAC582|nr:hypothetical protein [Streptomyces sp. SID13726]NEA97703.1 hypothetical protein [Streptomyces sp. SID13726]
MAEIRVTSGRDGMVRVSAGRLSYDDEAAPGPDFTRAVLEVAGALLVWPVLGEPGPPVAEVHDVERAQQWLWALYGEEVAVAVQEAQAAQAAPEAQEGSPVRELTIPPTALAHSAARLAFGHWAARWWPASYTDGIGELEPGVLGLELAALTHECQELFADSDDFGDVDDFSGFSGFSGFHDSAADLIEEHEAALDPLIQWWRTATPQPTATTRHLDHVLRLIDDAADSAGLDGPALRRLRSALDQEQGPSLATAPVDPGTLFARQGGYALAAGAPSSAGDRVIARGSGTNDWRRYPPGFVDAAEDAVSWTARALGARRQIEVEVVAHVTAPVSGVPLVAEVLVDGGRPNRVPLDRRDDVWTGRGDLDLGPGPELSVATATPHIEVGVLLPGFDPGHGPGDRTDRDAVRELVRRRLTEAARAQQVTDAAQLPPHTGPDTRMPPFLAETLAAAATEEDY